MSDIWSFGLVMIECATGRYPFQEQANCIEMAQTILDSDVPTLSNHFSPNFRDFAKQCLYRDPALRLPADVLLGSPWLRQHGATSYEVAVTTVGNWISSMVGK